MLPVEVGKYITNPNVTLNLLIGTGGFMYGDTVDSSVDTIEFLNFFDHTVTFMQLTRWVDQH